MLLDRKLFLIAWLMLSINFAFSQTTFTTTGDWDNAANWLGSDIGDVLTDDVNLSANESALINNTFNYIIGDLVFGNDAGLTINTTGSLEVGQPGFPRNVTANNNATITVTGVLEIWGNLTVNTLLDFFITGTVVIHGNIVMNDGATMSVSNGTLTVDGNFIGGDDTDVSISGTGLIDVAGTVTVGVNSNLTGPAGSFHSGGACDDGGTGTFCNSTLPIKLLYFTAALEGSVVSLDWATESEDNFDRFEIEKAAENLVFFKITELPASSSQSASVKHYSYIDLAPYSGPNYYRLKAIDLDGTFEYFNIEFVNYRGERNVEIYPNPVTSILKLNVPFNPAPQDGISLLDMQGRVMLTGTINSSGIQEFTLGEHVKSGLYILKYNSTAFQRTVKVMVIR